MKTPLWLPAGSRTDFYCYATPVGDARHFTLKRVVASSLKRTAWPDCRRIFHRAAISEQDARNIALMNLAKVPQFPKAFNAAMISATRPKSMLQAKV